MSDNGFATKVGPYILSAMFLALVAAFLLERRAAGTSVAQFKESVIFGIQELGKHEEAQISRLISVIGAFRSTQEANLGKINAQLQGIGRLNDAADTKTSETEAQLPSDADQDLFTAAEMDRLPPLPPGLDPTATLADDSLREVVLQYRENPERRLNHAETAQALNIQAEARARVEVLQTRIQVAMVEAANVLRERGDFLEFARGQVYYSEPGLLSYGEELGPNGMRIFYLYREEFPEIYAMSEEKDRVPEIGTRRLLALINKG
jgi:hypothetical protein